MELPPRLGRKADEVLSFYGGLKGLADQPIWLVKEVLKAFFLENERKQIERYLVTKRGRP